MYLCYIDEAGCPGKLPSNTSAVQPVLIICGLMIPQEHLRELTTRFLTLKCRFDPSIHRGCKHFLETTRKELKGADLKKEIRTRARNRRRYIFHFLDGIFQLLEEMDAQIVARIYIKAPGGSFDGRAVYTSSIQQICKSFHRKLESADQSGMIIADSRAPALNSIVAHSIFTQKFRQGGDPFERILEMPTFGHSENHVPIQITDILCSAILVPIATHTYCTGHIHSTHVNPQDHLIKDRYAQRVRTLGFRYQVAGQWQGGLTVIDKIFHRSATDLFR